MHASETEAPLPQLFDDDLLILAGWCHAISFVANAARVPIEPGTPRFEDGA